MGGKSSPAPAPAPTYSPQEQAQAQLLLQQQQRAAQAEATRQQQAYEAQKAQEQRNYEMQLQQQERERQEQIAAKAEAERQRQLGVKTNQFNANVSAGQNYGQTKLGSLGFADTYGIGSAYDTALKDWQNTTGANLENYGGTSFDSQGQWDRAYNSAQDTERNKLQNGFSNLTNPGWQSSYFDNSADDSILEAILGKQFTDANTQFETAKARGQLTDGAYGNVQSTLADKKLAANSTLQDLGGGVLSGYRNQLTDQSKGFADKISSWNLGNNFNLDSVTGGFNNTKNELSGRLEGDVRRAVGDTQLFDTAKLLAGAGVTGGATNNPLQSAFTAAAANTNNQTEEQKRNTGTVGVF